MAAVPICLQSRITATPNTAKPAFYSSVLYLMALMQWIMGSGVQSSSTHSLHKQEGLAEVGRVRV